METRNRIAVLRRHAPSAFSAFMVVLFAAIVYSAAGWRTQARMFPWAVAVPALILGVMQLALEISRRIRGVDVSDEIVDLPVDDGVPVDVVVRRALAAAGWIFGYFGLVLLVGFIVASPVFVIAYLIVQARARWGTVLLCTVLVMLFQIGLFHHMLRVPWLQGVYPGPQRWLLRLLG